jgi:hypothetical protein
MKQVIVLVKSEVAEALKSYCKNKGTSMNLELERYITEKAKGFFGKLMPKTQLSYKEEIKSIFEGNIL